MTLAPDTLFAAYRIETLLGRGGMGEVYRATDGRLGRPVALKLVAPELAGAPGVRERFLAESRLAASLDHPHIVPIYEAGEADGRLFLAMRYVDGSDLGALLERDGRLAPERAVTLLRGIAEALDAAHDRGLVHRDVKPSNILVARTGRGDEHAYLADFGLVKQLGSGGGFTQSGQLLGSVDYVAPEQIEGRPIDARVDVYSLGCVLYAALSGEVPFPRDTDMATLWAHVQTAPPRPSAVDPALAPFDALLARALAKDPADRPASAGELLREATVALDGTGAVASPHREPSRDRSARPRWLLPTVAGIAAVLAIGWGLASFTTSDRPRDDESGQPSPTVAPFRPLTVGALEPGRYRTTLFAPRLEFEVPGGWTAIYETPDDLAIARSDVLGQVITIGRFGDAIDPQQYQAGVLEDDQFVVEELPDGIGARIEWLRTHPFLTIHGTSFAYFGTIGGSAVDFEPAIPEPKVDYCAPQGVRCLALFVPDGPLLIGADQRGVFTVVSGARYRIALVDKGAQTIAVAIEAEHAADWDEFVGEAQTIMSSIRFVG